VSSALSDPPSPPVTALPPPAAVSRKQGRKRRRIAVVLRVLTGLSLTAVVAIVVYRAGRPWSPEQAVSLFTDAIHDQRPADAWALMCRDHQDNYDGSVKVFAESIRSPEAGAARTFQANTARYDYGERGWFVEAVRRPDGEAGTFFVIWEDDGYRVCFPMPDRH
jgi:hypothetical protein